VMAVVITAAAAYLVAEPDRPALASEADGAPEQAAAGSAAA